MDFFPLLPLLFSQAEIPQGYRLWPVVSPFLRGWGRVTHAFLAGWGDAKARRLPKRPPGGSTCIGRYLLPCQRHSGSLPGAVLARVRPAARARDVTAPAHLRRRRWWTQEDYSSGTPGGPHSERRRCSAFFPPLEDRTWEGLIACTCNIFA